MGYPRAQQECTLKNVIFRNRYNYKSIRLEADIYKNQAKRQNLDIFEEDCLNLRNAFGNSSAEFNFCAVESSKPIKICQKCIHNYINLVNSYGNMSKLSVNSSTCLDLFVNQDRLQILNTVYSSSVDLWNRAKCYDCFQIEKGTQTPKKSKTFDYFETLYKKFQDCVNKNQVDLCPSCMKDYVALSDFYRNISDVNEKISYCIDIVDIFCGEKNAPMIVRQTRFAESINSLRQEIEHIST